MSLATPTAIRSLQRKLYRKAKAEPAFRFYLLYDKIYREDIFRHAYALARVLTRSPAFIGISDGATATQSCAPTRSANGEVHIHKDRLRSRS